MDSRYQLTDWADQDLFDISLYLARSASIEVAERFIEAFKQKFVLLADNPGIGRRREELAPGLRSIPEGRYVVFYRVLPESLLIVRVLHGSRDVERAFGDMDTGEDPGDE